MEWLDARSAAERLGVKQATLYAYVSRGVLRQPLRSRPPPQPVRPGRGRGAGAPRQAAPPPRADRDRHRVPHHHARRRSALYRGHDAVELATRRSFEEVAELLWCGELSETGPWHCPPAAVATARAVQAGLPGELLPLDRLHLAVTALAVSDPMRFQRDPDAVAATGRALIAGMVEALPPLSSPSGRSVVEMLWSRLSPRQPSGSRGIAGPASSADPAGRPRAGGIDLRRPGGRLGARGSVRRRGLRSRRAGRAAARRQLAGRGAHARRNRRADSGSPASSATGCVAASGSPASVIRCTAAGTRAATSCGDC